MLIAKTGMVQCLERLDQDWKRWSRTICGRLMRQRILHCLIVSKGASLGDFLLAPMYPIEKVTLGTDPGTQEPRNPGPTRS